MRFNIQQGTMNGESLYGYYVLDKTINDRLL